MLGLGLAGGGFADSYFEFHGGRYLPSESFTGHSAEVSGSIYHRFNPGQMIPLNGILRVREHYSVYDTFDNTSPSFALPHDHATTALRAGLRWGGKEPVIHPALAMEVSTWYEGQFRTGSGAYGDNGDRTLEPFAQSAFARALLNYTLPESSQSFDLSLTGGGTSHADRFSAYRAGRGFAVELPNSRCSFRVTFTRNSAPLSFVTLSGEYAVPLDAAKHWSLSAYGAVAEMDYLDGLSQPGHMNSGRWNGPGLSWRLLAGSGQLWLWLPGHSRWRARRAEHRHSDSIRFRGP